MSARWPVRFDGLARLGVMVVLMLLALPAPGLAQGSGGYGQPPDEYKQRVALLIGLGKYEGGRSKGFFRNLPMVANDLESVAASLEARGFDPVDVYADVEPPVGSRREFRPILPADEIGARFANAQHLDKLIRNRLTALADAGTRSLLVVYFSGHGGIFGKAERVLALPDSEVASPQSFLRVQDVLVAMTETAGGTDKMLVVDACADALRAQDDDRPSKSAEVLPVHLYSSKAGESSFFDAQLGMSVFTHYFVEAMQHADELGNGDNDGWLDTEEVRAYVMRNVPRHQRMLIKRPLNPQAKPQAAQHPWGSGGDSLVLFHSRKADNSAPGDPSRATSLQEAAARYQGGLR